MTLVQMEKKKIMKVKSGQTKIWLNDLCLIAQLGNSLKLKAGDTPIYCEQ